MDRICLISKANLRWTSDTGKKKTMPHIFLSSSILLWQSRVQLFLGQVIVVCFPFPEGNNLNPQIWNCIVILLVAIIRALPWQPLLGNYSLYSLAARKTSFIFSVANQWSIKVKNWYNSSETKGWKNKANM